MTKVYEWDRLGTFFMLACDNAEEAARVLDLVCTVVPHGLATRTEHVLCIDLYYDHTRGVDATEALHALGHRIYKL